MGVMPGEEGRRGYFHKRLFFYYDNDKLSYSTIELLSLFTLVIFMIYINIFFHKVTNNNRPCLHFSGHMKKISSLFLLLGINII